MKSLIIIIIITLLLLPTTAILLLRKTQGIHTEPSGQAVHFYQNHDFRQSFLSPENDLNTLVVKLKNPLMRNDQPITFKLYQDQNLVRTLNLSGNNIHDGDWIRFSFEKIEDSKNKPYTFVLSSPSATIENSIGVEMSNQKEAAFTSYHAVFSYPQLIVTIYTNFFNKLKKDTVFLIFLIFAILGTLATLKFASREK